MAADLAGRRAAEVQLEHRIVASSPSVTSASVHIDSFPFLGRLAASGHVSSVRADASDVTVSRLRFSSIHVDLHDVEVDRRRLLSDRQVDIRAVGRGEATADVAQADLRQALGGLPVTLGDGRVTVTIRGVTVAVSATVRDNVLRLSAGPLTVPAITLPKLPLLPCITDAVARPGVLRLSCQVSRVPDELLTRLRSRTTATG